MLMHRPIHLEWCPRWWFQRCWSQRAFFQGWPNHQPVSIYRNMKVLNYIWLHHPILYDLWSLILPSQFETGDVSMSTPRRTKAICVASTRCWRTCGTAMTRWRQLRAARAGNDSLRMGLAMAGRRGPEKSGNGGFRREQLGQWGNKHQ